MGSKHAGLSSLGIQGGLVPGSPVDARIHACPKASHKTAQNDARSRPSAPVRRQPRRAVPAHAQVQEPPSSADVQRQARVSRTASAAILVTPRKAARLVIGVPVTRLDCKSPEDENCFLFALWPTAPNAAPSRLRE